QFQNFTSPVSSGNFKIPKTQSHLAISKFHNPVSSGNFKIPKAQCHLAISKFHKPSFIWPSLIWQFQNFISPVSTLAQESSFAWPISPVSTLAHKPSFAWPISPVSTLAHKPSFYTGP
ncbi:hypothetical protein V8G54_037607, partial [Vigna mungo]